MTLDSRADMVRSMRHLLATLALLLGVLPASAKPPLVLAAASLQESLSAAADAWAAQGHERPTLSFAASSALARQIDAGAPADLFISADEPWMDDVQKNGKIAPGTRVGYDGDKMGAATAKAREAGVIFNHD